MDFRNTTTQILEKNLAESKAIEEERINRAIAKAQKHKQERGEPAPET